MSYKRGDVILVLFLDSNLRTAKRRPALIIQADGLATGLSQRIIAMISSNMSRGGVPFRVEIPLQSTASQGSGLRTDSIIMCDNIATVFETEIDRRIGELADMTPVDAALKSALAL